jgi:aminoglycoside phosphotransferase (APT) family kinase protein
MAVSNHLHPDQLRPRLEQWLNVVMPTDSGVAVSGIKVSSESGFSCETIVFDGHWTRDGTQCRHGFVARVAPADGVGLFPAYRLDEDAKIMAALAEHTDVPAPGIVGTEFDTEVLGGRFVVMDRIDGRVPADDPPYSVQGWVLELPPDHQATMIDEAVQTIAALTRVDWEKLELGGLSRVGLNAQLTYLEQLYESGHRGMSQPIISAGLEYLRANMPQAEPRALSWGDARIGNMIFDADCAVVGALDWELAAIASPEADIAYFLWSLRVWSHGLGAPSPPGFPDRTHILARFEQLSGHTLRHLDYYERYSAVFGAITMMRAANLMIATGMIPPDSPMPVVNPMSAMLADYLDLPAPSGEVSDWAGHR